jgi:hypothetical protein
MVELANGGGDICLQAGSSRIPEGKDEEFRWVLIVRDQVGDNMAAPANPTFPFIRSISRTEGIEFGAVRISGSLRAWAAPAPEITRRNSCAPNPTTWSTNLISPRLSDHFADSNRGNLGHWRGGRLCAVCALRNGEKQNASALIESNFNQLNGAARNSI